MFQIGKTIAMLLFNKNTLNKTELFRNLLSGLAMIIVIALVIAMLISALVLGAVIYSHSLLILAGINQHLATAIIVATVLAVIALLAKCLVKKIDDMKDFPDQLAQQESPIAVQASGIAKSFIDGLLNKKT